MAAEWAGIDVASAAVLTFAAIGTILKVVIAVAAGAVILWLGFVLLRLFSQQPPPPPPPGKMRKVRLNYRCLICGSEVRMTSAPTELPDPPRHCGDDMFLVAPVDE